MLKIFHTYFFLFYVFYLFNVILTFLPILGKALEIFFYLNIVEKFFDKLAVGLKSISPFCLLSIITFFCVELKF